LVNETGEPYAYVVGDPVNNVDPLGLSCEDGVGVYKLTVGDPIVYPNGEIYQLYRNIFVHEDGEEEDCGDTLEQLAGPIEPPTSEPTTSNEFGTEPQTSVCGLFECPFMAPGFGTSTNFPSPFPNGVLQYPVTQGPSKALFPSLFTGSTFRDQRPATSRLFKPLFVASKPSTGPGCG
jgi:hypothetical protein